MNCPGLPCKQDHGLTVMAGRMAAVSLSGFHHIDRVKLDCSFHHRALNTLILPSQTVPMFPCSPVPLWSLIVLEAGIGCVEAGIQGVD